jgi:septal ring-binding cell division protein DamX
MASSGKKGGGDFVLESRHLVGLFLVLVVIFGVVFTLGYLMGRTQYDAKLRAAFSKPAETSTTTQARPAATSKSSAEVQQQQPAKDDSGWDLYHNSDTTEPAESLQPATAKPAAAPDPRPARAVLPGPKSSATPVSSQKIATQSRSDIMLQVAAVRSEKDALALARALQQKKISAFVVKPGADNFYRVQVGPYPDAKAAAAARRDLESKGFKSIIKH